MSAAQCRRIAFNVSDCDLPLACAKPKGTLAALADPRHDMR